MVLDLLEYRVLLHSKQIFVINCTAFKLIHFEQ